MTYNQACELDPRIRTLESRIRKEIRDAWWQLPEQVWSTVYKPMIMRVVGWDAEIPELKSSLVYEMVYDRLRAIFEGGKA